MPPEKVLITVKTYPTISAKYQELACTAGLREDGSWIRLYPIPFRSLENNQRYSKYQWIEVDIARNKEDPRPESYKVLNPDAIKLLEKIGTSNYWEARRKIVLGKSKIYTNRNELIELAKANKISLAVFKPTEIINFVIEEAPPEWPPDKIDAVLRSFKQRNLFGDQHPRHFKIMPKIPKKFSYIFIDDSGNKSQLMIEDWETGQLYLNCLKKFSPEEAAKKVREKYFDDFVKTKDLYFFLGTTREWHIRKAKNPYIIIGTFHPPKKTSPRFFILGDGCY